MTDIHPIHHSLYHARVIGGPKVRLKPRNMAKCKMPSEAHREALTNIALEIFADCTNVGVPFQDALLAIYLSGLEHGHTITQKGNSDD